MVFAFSVLASDVALLILSYLLPACLPVANSAPEQQTQ